MFQFPNKMTSFPARAALTLLFVMLLTYLTTGMAKAGDADPEVVPVTVAPDSPLHTAQGLLLSDAELQALGIPMSDQTPATTRQPTAPDVLGGSYAYTPYGFIAGASAVDMGAVYSGGLMPGWQNVARFCPACMDPNYYSRGSIDVSTAAIASALQAADRTANYSLNLLNTTLSGGNWNQFIGQLAFPGGWSVSNSNDSVYSGAGFGLTDPVLLSVLGYNQSSPYNFTTQFLQNYNSLNAPWDTYGYNVWGRAAPPEQGSSLAADYQALGHTQAAFYYTDPALSDLRIEANTVLLYLLYYDPLYMFWSYELDYVLNAIFTTRPSYATLEALSNEIASWTEPPDNLALLEERYQMRLWYQYYYALVQYETLVYLASHPDLYTWTQDVTAWLNARAQTNWGGSQAIDWYAAWLQRWEAAVRAAAEGAGLEERIAHVLDAHPGYEEYVQLNNEVIDLLPTFDDHPAVEQLVLDTKTLFSNQAVVDQVNHHYQTYQNNLNALLRTTTFSAEIERYYEELNGLVSSDTEYNQLQFAVHTWLQELQRNVHDAVYNCYYYYGDYCDPYQDPGVLAQYTDETWQLIEVAALFYEYQTLYWHRFYQSDAYLSLEANALARLAGALAPISDQVAQTRETFNDRVAAIPGINSFNQQRDNLIAILRGDTTAGYSPHTLAPYAAASTALDARLDRMAELAVQLEESAEEERSYNVMLPVLIK